MDENGVTVPKEAPKYQLIITFDEATQNVMLTGNVPPSKITALGMIDMARHLLTSSWQGQTQNRSSGLFVPRTRGFGG